MTAAVAQEEDINSREKKTEIDFWCKKQTNDGLHPIIMDLLNRALRLYFLKWSMRALKKRRRFFIEDVGGLVRNLGRIKRRRDRGYHMSNFYNKTVIGVSSTVCDFHLLRFLSFSYIL